MPIEFRCTGCNKLLRVKEESAGKKAKCPQCSTLLTIPSAQPAAPDPADEFELEDPGPHSSAATASRPTGGENPFQAPQASTAVPGPAMGGGPTPIVPTRIEFGDVLGRTWQIFKMNMGILIGAPIVAYFIAGVAAGAMFVIAFIATLALGAVGAILFAVAYVGTLVFSFWIGLGVTVIYLKAARGDNPTLGDLFNGGRYFWRFLGAVILLTIMIDIGYLLLIVPGIILTLMYFPSPLLIVDRDQGVMDSLSTASAITKGNKLTMFGIWFVAILVGVALMVVTLGIGSLLVGPYLQLLLIVAYLSMAGQRTAA